MKGGTTSKSDARVNCDGSGCWGCVRYRGRGLDRRIGVSVNCVFDCTATVVVFHAETSGAAVLPPLAAAGAIAHGV